MRPLLITAMRSDSAITSSRSEVTKRMPRPVGREAAHGAEDVGLGPDVDAAARLVHQQHLRPGHQRLADDDLLLVAARERGDLERRVGDLDGEVADRRLDGLALALAADVEEPEELRQARQREVRGDREDRDEALALPVLGDEREAAADTARHVAFLDRPPRR